MTTASEMVEKVARTWAERIVAENVEAWRWGPLSEIEGLAEHKLAVDAAEAGLRAALSAIDSENERLREALKRAALDLHEAATAIETLLADSLAAEEMLRRFAKCEFGGAAEAEALANRLRDNRKRVG